VKVPGADPPCEPVSLILDTGVLPWHHHWYPLWLVPSLTCITFW
jgi:hypothetical protein